MSGVQTGTYPVAEDVMNLSRAIINDMLRTTAGQVLTDVAPFTLPFLNSAIQDLQKALANNGVPANIYDNVILTPLTAVENVDPSVQVYIGPNGYNNGSAISKTPALPTNLIVPLLVWQRVTGSGQQFTKVAESHDGIQSQQQGTYFAQWEWRNDYIWFNGSTSSLDIRVRYKGSIPYIKTDANFSETVIPIRGGTNALAYGVAAMYSESRNSAVGPAQAQYARTRYDYFMDQLVNEYVRAQQRVAFRSHGFREGEDTIDGSLAGSYGP